MSRCTVFLISVLLGSKTATQFPFTVLIFIAIQHPSQRQHSCLMMDGENAWMYYYDDVVEKIDLSLVLKTGESVCSALGIKLGKSLQP